MNIYLVSKKMISLPTDCISGGEGSVYIKNGMAYKIYHDKKKALSKEKYNELKTLDKDNIIKPEELIYNYDGEIIGYSMKYIPNTVSLSRLMTNEYREINNITHDDILNLIQQIKETITFIHSKQCLIIDGNEMNYLVSENFKHIYFIDVDSYKTVSFPGNAYSVSTLDPLVENKKDFSQTSDWFAFAIIACNLLIGIHPFKGNYKGFSYSIKKGDIKNRMLYKKSVFNDKVFVNSAVRSFDLIPLHYKQWFISLFEKGERSYPPIDISKDKKLINQAIHTVFNKHIKTIELYAHHKEIKNIFFGQSTYIQDDKYYTNINNKNKTAYKHPESSFISIDNKDFLVKANQYISLFDLNENKIIKTDVESEGIFVVNNRLYSIFNNHVYELFFKYNKLLINNSWNILSNFVSVYKNVVNQPIHHKNVLYIPFEHNNCSLLQNQEFDHVKIVNAFYQNKVLEVVYFKEDKYIRAIYKLNDFHTKLYSVYKEETENLSINTVVLNNGIAISGIVDGELFMFFNDAEKNAIKIIKDENFKIIHTLHTYNNEVFIKNINLFQKITMN